MRKLLGISVVALLLLSQACTPEEIYIREEGGRDVVVRTVIRTETDTFNTVTVIAGDSVFVPVIINTTDTLFIIQGQNCPSEITFDMDNHYPDQCRLWSKLRVEWECNPEPIEIVVNGTVTRIFTLPQGWSQVGQTVYGIIESNQLEPLGIDLLNYCVGEEIVIKIRLSNSGHILYSGRRRVV